MFSSLTEMLQEAGKQEASSMSQVLRFSAAGQEAWRRRSVFLPGTCDTNQSYVPSSVAGLPSLFRPATINNQTCDICQRDFLANLLPSVEDGRCGRGLRGGWAGKVSFQRRHLAQGKPLEGRQSQVSGQGPRHIIRPCPAAHLGPKRTKTCKMCQKL